MPALQFYVLFLIGLLHSCNARNLSVHAKKVTYLETDQFQVGDVFEFVVRIERRPRPTIIALREVAGGSAKLFLQLIPGKVIIIQHYGARKRLRIVFRLINRKTYVRIRYAYNGLQVFIADKLINTIDAPPLIKEVTIARSSVGDKMKLVDESRYLCANLTQCGKATLRPIQIPRDICGNHRIVGGGLTKPGKHPWQVALRKKYANADYLYHFCGGVLIDKCWVLTAAHCFESYGSIKKNIIVRVGDYSNINVGSFEASQDLSVDQIYKHEAFRRMEGETQPDVINDIALVKLQTCAVLNEFVKPICLPTSTTQFQNENCTITGWGAQQFKQDQRDFSSCLQQVSIPLKSDEECKAEYGTRVNTTTTFCAGRRGADSCQGDSGGPLVCGESPKYLWGLTSFGKNCGTHYGVYTEVITYREWILNKLKCKTVKSKDIWL